MTTAYRIELDDAGQGETIARLDFTYTARNEEGERVIADHGAARRFVGGR